MTHPFHDQGEYVHDAVEPSRGPRQRLGRAAFILLAASTAVTATNPDEVAAFAYSPDQYIYNNVVHPGGDLIGDAGKGVANATAYAGRGVARGVVNAIDGIIPG